MGHYACDMRPEWFAPEPPEVTDLFPGTVKPVRVGWYEHLAYDAGWVYDWRIWWDGSVWLDQPKGSRLLFQDIAWRGLTTEQTK